MTISCCIYCEIDNPAKRRPSRIAFIVKLTTLPTIHYTYLGPIHVVFIVKLTTMPKLRCRIEVFHMLFKLIILSKKANINFGFYVVCLFTLKDQSSYGRQLGPKV
jgi:hypothetical protein